MGSGYYCHSTSAVPIENPKTRKTTKKTTRSTPYETKRPAKRGNTQVPVETPHHPSLEVYPNLYPGEYQGDYQDPLMAQVGTSTPPLASLGSMLDWSAEYYQPQTPVNEQSSPNHLESGSVGLTGSPTSSHLSYENGESLLIFFEKF